MCQDKTMPNATWCFGSQCHFLHCIGQWSWTKQRRFPEQGLGFVGMTNQIGGQYIMSGQNNDKCHMAVSVIFSTALVSGLGQNNAVFQSRVWVL